MNINLYCFSHLLTDITDSDNGQFICTLIGDDGLVKDKKTVDVTVISKWSNVLASFHPWMM